MRHKNTLSRVRGFARAGVSGLCVLALVLGAACDGCNPPPETKDATVACTPGTQGCACHAGQCNAGLECRAELCQPVVAQVGLVVSSPDARACEVLLEHATDVQVVYGSALQGKAIHEGDRLALAFTAAADTAIAASDVELTLKPGGAGSLAALQVVTSSCFGHDGAALAGASVSLNLGN
ncbi:MAG: hypothetical protein ABIJ09_24520 [Pseudomonadota bacterium]